MMLLVEDLSLLERLLAGLDGTDPMWAYCLLALFALVEFVFPPFPGDLVTVGSAFVIRARGWSMTSAFVAILLGSMAGGALQFGLGRYVRKHALDQPGSWMARSWLQLEPWRRKVDQHGALLILVSRFLPVLRGPLLLAAGMTQVHLPSATMALVVGVSAWNVLLLFLGSLAGSDPVRVGRWLGTYAMLLWVVLGAVMLVWWLRWRRSQRRPAA